MSKTPEHATIYDIAREAKVGIGTVSRVFNNHPSVSEETRQRVLQVASRLAYHPHPYARGLARKRTNSILAVIPFFTTFFFVEIFKGVQAKLSQLDCDLILYGVNYPDQVEMSVQRNALRSRVDGVLFLSMKAPVALFQERFTPLVLVDTHHEKYDSIYVENVTGAMAATQYLISLGHRKIGMICANLQSRPARERLEGFRRALNEAGITIRDDYAKISPDSALDGFTREAGYQLMKEFLAMGKEMPTAIFVSSDIQASGALQAIEEAGKTCPGDVALVGFDDIELANHLGLTTMRQPMRAMGELAVEMLFERIKNPHIPARHRQFLPELVVRRTSGPPRT